MREVFARRMYTYFMKMALMAVFTLVIALGVFGAAGQAQAAVDCTTVTTGPAQSAAHSSYTITSHPVSGSDRLLLVFAQGEGDQPNPDVSSVTFNGATSLTSFHVAGPTRGVYVQIWYALNPPVATGNVVLTYGGSTDNSGAVAVTCTGVDQTTPLGAVASALSTGSNLNTNLGGITTTFASSLLVGAVTGDGGDTAPHSPLDGQTETWDFASGTSGFADTAYAGGYLAAPTTGLYNFDWSQAVSDDWAVAVVEVVPVQCTDSIPSNLQITVPPANNSTVSGNVTITATADEAMSNMTVTVTGSTGATCDVAAQAMSGTGPYTYSWDTSVCGAVTVENPVTITVDGNEPECSFAQQAQWNNISIDNRCVATAPNNLADTAVTKNQVDLQWSGANCGASGNDYYIVYRDGNPLTGICDNITCVAGTNNMTCSDTSAKADTSYAYTVRGYNTTDTCTSQASNIVNVTTPVDPYQFSGGVCGGCHTYPPTDGTRAGATGAFEGDHQVHRYPCSTCHIAPDTETSTDYDHRNGTITMATSGVGATAIRGGYYDRDSSGAYNAAGDDEWAQTNSVITQSCSNISCHGGNNPTPQWGFGTATCVDCHNAAISITQGPAAGGTRRNVVAEFSRTWSHKRSAAGAVTAGDCIVCHMEGVKATLKTDAAYHADGYVDLRDPDTGTAIEGANWAGAGAGSYTSTGSAAPFTQFSRNLASNTLEANVTAIQINHCLKCHDANGANNANAQVAGGTALRPFNTAPTHTPGNNVLDVDTHFNTSNSSYHPIKGRQNNTYADDDRMAAPWNTIAKTEGGALTQWGDLISCWDCHAPDGTPSTVTLTSTVTAHGGATTLRGTSWVSGSPSSTNAVTLCVTCHANYVNPPGGTPGHGTGSAAFDLARNEKTDPMQYGCFICHGSNDNPGRPTLAADAHGFNGTWGGGNAQVAFIRNTDHLTDHQPASIGGTSYASECTGMFGTGCNSNRTETYSPGGVY